MTELKLEDKVAIVTGGGSGIGECIAKEYAKEGAHIVVASRNQENLNRVAAEVESLGRQSLAVGTDVSVPGQVDNMVKQTMDKFGRIDILVNNAGAAITFKRAEELTTDEWNATVALNLTAPFLCCSAAGKVMIEQAGGKIINVSSAAGLRGVSFMAHYSAAKRGLISLTESLASGWAKHNITVNCICPGLITTQVEIERGSIPPTTRKDGTPVPPLLYPPAPENVADLALFLASSAADHITGELMVIRAANS
jgi:NAD(P)-dependent dehydrogenase (short-subunit alcohol dehydrogenase family)|tara:strand:+ start:3511 stop:4269 length:759 start_codon:yes stop_codon:yes gene_type:complete